MLRMFRLKAGGRAASDTDDADDAGFTPAEIIIGVILVGILATGVTIKAVQLMDQARDSAAQQTIRAAHGGGPRRVRHHPARRPEQLCRGSCLNVLMLPPVQPLPLRKCIGQNTFSNRHPILISIAKRTHVTVVQLGLMARQSAWVTVNGIDMSSRYHRLHAQLEPWVKTPTAIVRTTAIAAKRKIRAGDA